MDAASSGAKSPRSRQRTNCARKPSRTLGPSSFPDCHSEINLEMLSETRRLFDGAEDVRDGKDSRGCDGAIWICFGQDTHINHMVEISAKPQGTYQGMPRSHWKTCSSRVMAVSTSSGAVDHPIKSSAVLTPTSVQPPATTKILMDHCKNDFAMWQRLHQRLSVVESFLTPTIFWAWCVCYIRLRIPEHLAGHSDNIRPPIPGYPATLV